jgi:polyhydroxybutyrate depolymerase
MGLDRAGTRRGFIVVSPDALHGTWALGCNCTAAEQNGVDDLRFVDDLLAQLADGLPIDRARVYATGLSDGGTFSYRLACERAKMLAAIAVVSGNLAMDPADCRPARPVPVLAIHGTMDPIIPFENGEKASQLWARLDGCKGRPVESARPDKADDGTAVTLVTYPGCRAPGEVQLYRINGGGHTWPGSPTPLPARLGRQSLEIDASEAILDFFARHPSAP